MSRVKLTNADKVLYPATGTTKSDIFDYYTDIAEVMVPHIAGRAATRKRWPNGVNQPSFFEKQLAASAPDWLPRASVVHKSGTTTYPIIDSADGLAWIAQQAALEVHVPQWRFEAEWTRKGEQLKPGPATRLVFDLDPGDGVTMAQLAKVARAVRDLMTDIGLTTFPLTSGSKGLHLYCPLDKPVSSRGAVVLAKRVAQQLETSMPKLVTATMTKSLRGGQGVRGLEPEQRFQDHDRAVFATRTGISDRRRAAHAGTSSTTRSSASLRYDEVLERVQRDGDLLAPLDADLRTADRLTKYRSMRDASKTPEPVPSTKPAAGKGNSFVIQEHHARRLHYDFRLERDGVLVSWAVPKNLPETTAVNHLAVHTEDHPLEYGSFEGTIPKGEYGGGKVVDLGLRHLRHRKVQCRCRKGGEVIVTLHGQRISGRYALIQTNGDQWLAHRMKDQHVFAFDELAPMLTTHGSVAKLTASQWAFEAKWDGYRLLVDADHGTIRLRSRSGRDVTEEFPQLRSIADDLADHHVVLDGEVVALDASGVPRFSEMQNRARATRDRVLGVRPTASGRAITVAGPVTATGDNCWKLWPRALRASSSRTCCPVTAREALEYSREHQWEGVIAKKRDSTYQPGRRSASWIKDKILEHPGSRHRRLARRQRRSQQPDRLTDDRYPRRGRTALRRSRRHRVHRSAT